MYSTCLFCNRSLGTNDVLEWFPVGRRIAFDSAKGRLWVVCGRCERWNLSPLEERWEACEECERLFRGTRLRMSTDQIGLAKIREGLELVRIGAPLRPEFAAWRYGDQFGRRRRRALLWAGAGIVAVGAVTAGSIALGAGVSFVPQIPNLIMNIPVRARLRTTDGRLLKFRYPELQKIKIVADPATNDLTLNVKHSKGKETFSGPEAMRVASQLLPAVNRMAGSRKVIRSAVGQIEDAGDPEAYLAGAARRVSAEIGARARGRLLDDPTPGMLHKLTAPTRLALEMALHEEQERRALAGELVELELAWREAEEVAQIADDLLVPPEHAEFIARHRQGGGPAAAAGRSTDT